MDAATYAQGLREFADWVEANEELIAWELGRADEDKPFHFNLYATNRGDFLRYVKAAGRGAKEVDGTWFHIVREFGPVKLDVFCTRDLVCERVVKGTREVTKTIRDPEALEAVPLVEVTETVEDVEWVCPPALLAVEEEAAV